MYDFPRYSTGDELLFGEPQDICATTFTNSPSDPRLYAHTAYGATPTLPRVQARDPGSSVDDNKENVPT